MFLYEIPRGSKIHVEAKSDLGTEEMLNLTFQNLDGMYSVCTIDGKETGENIVHLSVSTPLEWCRDHYEIKK